MRLPLFLLAFMGAQFARAQYQYGCVIDAGSTGSRIVVFRWETREFTINDLPPPITSPFQIVAYSPGRDFLETRVDTAVGRQNLKTLLEYAQAKLREQGVSADAMKAIPLYLKATAGMRVLSDEERVAAMSDVRSILSAGPFLFKPSWARTISGEEEGVAGWIAVNYQEGSLPGQSTASRTTVGALDLGGASAQITFVPPAGVDILSSQFDLRLTIASQTSLYTHSFLYYGQTEAIRRINELVVLSSGAQPGVPPPAGSTIPHPCYLAGTPGGVSFNSSIAGGMVNFSGTSNWTACREFVTPLMLRGAQCLTDPKPDSWPQAAASSSATAMDWAALQRLQGIAPLPVINPYDPGSSCSIGGQYQPPLVPSSLSSSADSPVRFVAFSSFSFVYESLALNYSAALSELRTKSATFCNLDYAGANASFPTGPFFTEHCIRAVYALTLLVDGYGLDASVPGIVTVVPSKPGVSFAMGSMVYEANGLPFSLRPANDQNAGVNQPQATTVIALAVALGVVLFGALVSGFVVWRRWPKTSLLAVGLL